MDEPAILTEGLTKRYGQLVALDHVDLRVEAGEIVGFLGPNGAGKTTAIRLLLDIIRPSEGRAAIFGHDCQAESVVARSLVGYLAGDMRVYEHLTSREMIRLLAGLRQRPVDFKRAFAMANRLELALDRRISTLSKGNRQKLGIILPLLDQPPLVLLDEPASGLDPLVQHAVWDILREEAANGTCVFFSSHVMSEVEAVCERVAILRQGRLIAFETIDAIKRRSLRHVTVRFGDKAPDGELDEIEGVRVIEREDGMVRMEVQDNMNDLIAALNRYDIADLESVPPSLDEIIVGLYRGEAPE